MAVNVNDISSKEDTPRFVSRKHREQLRRELEATRASSSSASKRAKINNDLDTAETELGDSNANAPQKPRAQSVGNPQPADPLEEYPVWRLEREKALQRQAHEEQRQGSQAGVGRHKKWFEKARDEMTDRDWRIMRADLQITCASLPRLEPLLSWQELPDKSMAQRLANGPYKRPTPVQRATVPIALAGDDVIGIAQTGSGKTLGFTVPLLLSDKSQSLVLAPTRELALQIASVISEFAAACGASVVSLVGGRDFGQQTAELETAINRRSSRLVIVATPGRLLDFTEQKLLNLKECLFLVLDEADRMIDLGFEEQIAGILKLLPATRQTLMYTATWPRQIQDLTAKFTRPGLTHKVEIGSTRRSTSVRQTAELLEAQGHKLARLNELVHSATPPVIVFVATKAESDEIAPRLRSAVPLHGSMTQDKREATISALRSGSVKCIVATDVASRGLDVPDVSLVVNYDMPNDIDTYIHRIGRTGRAGKQGRSVSLCLASDAGMFKDLRRVFRESGSPVPTFLL